MCENLLHSQVKELLNLYNKLYPYDRRTIHHIWQNNYHELTDLRDLDDGGPFNYATLTTVIKSYNDQEKKQRKREDDDLFNKLSLMKKQREQKKKI